jgi:membrane protein
MPGFKPFLKAFGKAFTLFVNNDVPRMSAALSFYTFFALAPIIVLVTFFSNWIYKDGVLEAGIYLELSQFLGTDAAAQVRQVVLNSGQFDWSNPVSIITLIALIFSATGVFTEIQSSVNLIWSLKAKPKKGWLKFIVNRFMSLSIIIGLGFIMMVSLIISTGIDILVAKLSERIPSGMLVASWVINLLFTLIVISLVFGIIYKFLPDAKVKWSNITIAAITTALFFMLGKYLISLYIGQKNPTSVYGTAGSIVVVLLWVYFSSMILYFGACVTKTYAQISGQEIYPNEYAVFVESVEITNKKSLQLQDDNMEVKSKDVDIQIAPGAELNTKQN